MSDTEEKVSDENLDYQGDRGLQRNRTDPVYNDNIYFYYGALFILGAIGLWAMCVIGKISSYALEHNESIDIPDILVSVVSAIIGAIAGLFAKK